MENNKCILVGVNIDDDNFDYTMEELKNLAEACNYEYAGMLCQNMEKPTPNFYIGSGKVIELKELCNELDVKTAIFNTELSPAHIRNLEDVLELRVIDRTLLILDIFAKRAKTKEAMLQVELAQLNYMLPRLIGLSRSFSRQAGGAKLRGPGEKKLELDRRRILTDISNLKHELKDLKLNRSIQREKRKKNNIPTVALVGYTNAGKSTLMNAILTKTNASEKYVFEKDMLFATLETSTRRFSYRNKDILLTDTVGFVSNLPHHLVESFKSTLEEVKEATYLIHVVDASHAEYQRQIQVTEDVLKELSADKIKSIIVFNKIDLLEQPVFNASSNTLSVSAKNDINIDLLLEQIFMNVYPNIREIEMLIPYEHSGIFSYLKENALVLEVDYLDEGIKVKLEADEVIYNIYNELIIK